MMSTMTKHFQPFMMAEERAARSVFVGNIPYEATEEQLKEIFCQAGPVVSFRLVYDRETGKPKGYGFCEYQDVETAQSAMRNLNNHDFNGRPLRVGVAAGEQTKDENRAMQQALGGPISESPYGDPVDPDKAPEAISRAVASLPPEQMFELMKQMKLCIQNNPNEARNMLLQNPQLAYALLQAQIVMKIVDPQVALAMLHRQTEQIPPVMPSGCGPPLHQPLIQQHNSMSIPSLDIRPGNSFSGLGPSISSTPSLAFGATSCVVGPDLHSDIHMDNLDSRHLDVHKRTDCRNSLTIERRDMAQADCRDFGFKGFHSVDVDQHGPVQSNLSMIGLSSRTEEVKSDFGSKLPTGVRPGIVNSNIQRQEINAERIGPSPISQRQDLLLSGRPDQTIGNFKGQVRENESSIGSRIVVGSDTRDPRQAADVRRTIIGQGPVSRLMMSSSTLGSPISSTSTASNHDQEKAALIMQVLQLSDEQIALLPVDQRQSILILKDQIARSANQGET